MTDTLGADSHQDYKESPDSTKYHKEELISDQLIQGHFYKGTNILVDVRVTNIYAKYHTTTNPVNILVIHENTNKKK